MEFLHLGYLRYQNDIYKQVFLLFFVLLCKDMLQLNLERGVKLVSDAQRLEILQKMSLIISNIKTCNSIKELSDVTGIPSSTIQRYLNRKDYFEELAKEGILKKENVDVALDYTKGWLEKSKEEGVKRGGKSSQEKYSFKKDNEGKFRGSGR